MLSKYQNTIRDTISMMTDLEQEIEKQFKMLWQLAEQDKSSSAVIKKMKNLEKMLDKFKNENPKQHEDLCERFLLLKKKVVDGRVFFNESLLLNRLVRNHHKTNFNISNVTMPIRLGSFMDNLEVNLTGKMSVKKPFYNSQYSFSNTTKAEAVLDKARLEHDAEEAKKQLLSAALVYHKVIINNLNNDKVGEILIKLIYLFKLSLYKYNASLISLELFQESSYLTILVALCSNIENSIEKSLRIFSQTTNFLREMLSKGAETKNNQSVSPDVRCHNSFFPQISVWLADKVLEHNKKIEAYKQKPFSKIIKLNYHYKSHHDCLRYARIHSPGQLLEKPWDCRTLLSPNSKEARFIYKAHKLLPHNRLMALTFGRSCAEQGRFIKASRLLSIHEKTKDDGKSLYNNVIGNFYTGMARGYYVNNLDSQKLPIDFLHAAIESYTLQLKQIDASKQTAAINLVEANLGAAMAFCAKLEQSAEMMEQAIVHIRHVLYKEVGLRNLHINLVHVQAESNAYTHQIKKKRLYQLEAKQRYVNSKKHIQQGNIGEAFKALATAQKHDESFIPVYVEIGLLFQIEGKTEESKAAFKAVIAIIKARQQTNERITETGSLGKTSIEAYIKASEKLSELALQENRIGRSKLCLSRLANYLKTFARSSQKEEDRARYLCHAALTLLNPVFSDAKENSSRIGYLVEEAHQYHGEGVALYIANALIAQRKGNFLKGWYYYENFLEHANYKKQKTILQNSSFKNAIILVRNQYIQECNGYLLKELRITKNKKHVASLASKVLRLHWNKEVEIDELVDKLIQSDCYKYAFNLLIRSKGKNVLAPTLWKALSNLTKKLNDQSLTSRINNYKRLVQWLDKEQYADAVNDIEKYFNYKVKASPHGFSDDRIFLLRILMLTMPHTKKGGILFLNLHLLIYLKGSSVTYEPLDIATTYIQLQLKHKDYKSARYKLNSIAGQLDNGHVANLKISLCMKEEKWAEALMLLELMISSESNSFERANSLQKAGVCLQKIKRYNEASDYFFQAYTWNPELKRIREQLSETTRLMMLENQNHTKKRQQRMKFEQERSLEKNLQSSLISYKYTAKSVEKIYSYLIYISDQSDISIPFEGRCDQLFDAILNKYCNCSAKIN
jgi:hypothetical protein